HEREGVPIVCPDAIRLALHGQRYLPSAEPLVWQIAQWMVRSLFHAGHPAVLVDATHTTRQRRDFWKDASWRRVFVVLDTSKEECLRRAQAEGDTEIVAVIERMAAQWEPLAAEEIDP